MSFKVKCTCGKLFGVKDQYAGKKGICPHCGEKVLLQPDPGLSSASADKKTKSHRKHESDSAHKPAPVRPARKADSAVREAVSIRKAKSPPDPAPAERKAKQLSADDLVSMRTGPAPVSKDGNVDVTSQMAGIRHIVQRFCPTCGTRYNEGQARCSNCHAPLTKEEIEAAERAKKPPLIPWLPRINLSPRAKVGVSLLGVALLGLIVYLCMLPTLNRKARLEAELSLVKYTVMKAPPAGVDRMLALTFYMPGYPYNRPATVDAIGKWARRLGPAVFDTVGSGTYDLQSRRLLLKAKDGAFTYDVTLPPVLSMAARAGDIALVRQLLDEPGCDVNERDAHGSTALHAAAGAPGDPVQIVELLLRHGADRQLMDGAGRKPADIARSRNNSKIVEALRPQSALGPRR